MSSTKKKPAQTSTSKTSLVESMARLDSELSVAKIEGNGQKIQALTKVISYFQSRIKGDKLK